MATQQVVNGVDVNRLKQTIGNVSGDPERAQFQFRATHKWLGGAHACTTIEDFFGAGREDTSRRQPFRLEADEPAVLLGEDHGPNATEALLHALASCLSSTFIYHAAAKGIDVEGLTLELEGDLDIRGFLGVSNDVRNGFSQIRVTFRVDSDAPRKQIEELVALAQRRSPVFDMVSNPVPVAASLAMQ